MPSLNFLLRAPASMKRVVGECRPYLRYVRGIVGLKNLASGIQLCPRNLVASENMILVANDTKRLVSCSMLSSDLAIEPISPVKLNVESNTVDIVALSGHEGRFFFSLMDKPTCITRRFKGIRLGGYSRTEKELVNAVLNSLLVKWFWLIASARTYAALVAHHINIVRRDFISIDWTRLSDENAKEIVELFHAACADGSVESLRRFNVSVLAAIGVEESSYNILLSDLELFFSGSREPS